MIDDPDKLSPEAEHELEEEMARVGEREGLLGGFVAYDPTLPEQARLAAGTGVLVKCPACGRKFHESESRPG
jgi:hypothetical protein